MSESPRLCAFFDDYSYFPTRSDTFFGAGLEKVCLGGRGLQILLNDTRRAHADEAAAAATPPGQATSSRSGRAPPAWSTYTPKVHDLCWGLLIRCVVFYNIS